MGELEPRAPTARDVVAYCVDAFKAAGTPLPSRYKNIIGKQAKELLDDGFDYDVVAKAAELALLRGEPHVTLHIAADLARAQAGLKKLTRGEYERRLQDEQELEGR